MYTIYQIVNSTNKKSYIGFTTQPVEKRWYQHLWEAKNRGGASPLHASIRKYGEDNFQFSILEEGLSPEIGLKVREPYWISVLKPEYNLIAGGEGTLGCVFTNERRKLASLRMMGKRYSLGRIISKEQKDQQSKFMLGNKFAFGSRHTEEWKKNKSETMKRYHLNRRLEKV